MFPLAGLNFDCSSLKFSRYITASTEWHYLAEKAKYCMTVKAAPAKHLNISAI